MRAKICLGLLIASMTMLPAAKAGTKEELLRLQSDVNLLRDQIRELERTFNERIDGIKSLTVQLNDQVAKSNLILDQISKTLESQASGQQSSDQMLMQEVRTLSQKMDDTATRVSAMAQQLRDLKVQSKSFSQANPLMGNLPPDDLFDQANRDFVQGNFDLAIQEFTAYLNSYPGGDKAAAALCNIGDAYSYQNQLLQAVNAFTRVINEYPDSDKVASALYKRANAELSMSQNDKAEEDLKNVVENYPDTPESELAKGVLQKLGVRIPRPAKKTRR